MKWTHQFRQDQPDICWTMSVRVYRKNTFSSSQLRALPQKFNWNIQQKHFHEIFFTDFDEVAISPGVNRDCLLIPSPLHLFFLSNKFTLRANFHIEHFPSNCQTFWCEFFENCHRQLLTGGFLWQMVYWQMVFYYWQMILTDWQMVFCFWQVVFNYWQMVFCFWLLTAGFFLIL